MSIDNENLLFNRLKDYSAETPNLISRRQYNDRRKFTRELCKRIRKRMVDKMDGVEEFFCVDSKTIEICRLARASRCTMGATDYSAVPPWAIAPLRICITSGINSTQSVG